MRTIAGTSKPQCAVRTLEISTPTGPGVRRALRTNTLPDWMWVCTSENPASPSASRRESIFTNRPPTFTARRKAM